MGFSDVTEPTSHLTAPSAPVEWVDPLKPLNTAGDLISPTFWVSEILDMTLGFNPKEEVQKYFAGDWEAYAKVGEVWENLGKLCEGVSDNLKEGNTSLDATWDGNAGDAAYVYFKTLADKCGELKGELDTVMLEYQVISEAVWSAGQLVGSLVSQIGDAAAVAALSYAGGTLLSWTGFGAAIGYGAAAIETARIIQLWGDATKAVNNAQALAHASLAVLGTTAGGIATKFADFPIPEHAYDHPAATA